MRVVIESAKILDVAIPFIRPMGWASSASRDRAGCVLVLSGGGHLGFAGAPTFASPIYDEQFVGQTHGALGLFLAAIFAAGTSHRSGAIEISIQEASGVLKGFKGNTSAKAAIEVAMLDLFGRQRGLRAGETLASYARIRGHCELAARFDSLDETTSLRAQGTSLGMISTPELRVQELGRLASLGYRRVKVKVDSSVELGEMRALCASSQIELSADANGSMSDPKVVTALFEAGFCYIEQPFVPGSMRSLARLHDLTPAKIALDESISSLAALEDLIAYVRFDIAVLKLSRLGGIGPLLDAVAIAEAAHVGFFIGGMYDTPILRRLNALMVKALAPSEISDLGPDADYFGPSVSPALYRGGDGSLMILADDGISGSYIPGSESILAVQVIKN